MSIQAVDDARRWMGFHSIGTVHLLIDIQADIEDFVGAVRDGRSGVAAHAVRSLVLRCLGVRSLGAGGGVPDFDDPLTDPFHGLPDEVVEEGFGLVARCARVTGQEDLDEVMADVLAYARAFERELGFDEPPPSIRRPEGLYPALRLAREILPLNEASGYPLALPSDWLPQKNDKTAAAGKEQR